MSRSPTKKTIEIILCPSCKGEGKIEHEEMTCYHNRLYRYWDELCTRCDGSGRLKKRVEIFEIIEPYVTPELKKSSDEV